MSNTNAQMPISRKQVFKGIVVSDKMQKTIVVKVKRKFKHPLYKKYIIRSKSFKTHDEKNRAKIGDQVEIIGTRPLSKEKRWVLKSILSTKETIPLQVKESDL